MSKTQGRTQRQLQIGEELRHALSEIMLRDMLHDPALSGVPITVSEVRASPDLKNATAFVSPLGGGNSQEVLVALRGAAPFFRGQMAKMIRLRHVPKISFQLDQSFDEAEHIGDLLNKPEVKRDLQKNNDPDPETD